MTMTMPMTMPMTMTMTMPMPMPMPMMTKEPLSELGQLLYNILERKVYNSSVITGHTEAYITVNADYVKPNVRMCKDCIYCLVCLTTHRIIEIYEREHNSMGVPLCCNCYAPKGYIVFYTADRGYYLGYSLLENKVTDFNFSYKHSSNVHYNFSLVKKALVALQENFSQLSLKNERIEEIINIFKQHGNACRQQPKGCIWVRLS